MSTVLHPVLGSQRESPQLFSIFEAMAPQKLEKLYRERYESVPSAKSWIGVPPAVPFIGNQYGALGKPKVLVYGSAENLNFDFTPEAMTYNRNRVQLRVWKTTSHRKAGWSKDDWFPWVHMAPISDGTLLTAARYLLHLHGLLGFSKEPGRFIEQIAVGNFGKFSLNGNKNQDYASRANLLRASFPYVEMDLRILQPDILILPRTIHRHGLKPLLDAHLKLWRPRQCWLIYQTNRRVITTHVERQLQKAGIAPGTIKDRPEWVSEWTGHITRAPMARYLDWIDWRTGRVQGSVAPDWRIQGS